MNPERGAIAWMAANPVAANILLLVVFLLGLAASSSISKETFPTIELELVRISVPYPGSSPEEVEEGVILKIEEAIQDLEDLKSIRSEARESVGIVTAEMQPRSDMSEALNKITTRVNGIGSFPAETEEPVIEKLLAKGLVIKLSIAGALSETQLKVLADSVRDELLALPGVTQVRITGTRDYEIAIEMSDEQLRRYGLSFDQVVNLIRGQSRNLPGGNMRTGSGTVTLRSQGQAYSGAEFAALPLISRADGTRITVGDIATVRDGFVDQPIISEVNGKPAIGFTVYSLQNQNSLEISRLVREYAETLQRRLPPEVEVVTWNDSTEVLKGRINLMLKNAAQGGVLVLITLALFLRWQVALWVVVGVPFCFLGALWVMSLPFVDITINVISVFGFILVLGIVVDDAIVTGESAYHEMETHGASLDNIVRGVQKVAVPTIFGVLTTVVAFSPSLTLSSGMGRFMSHIGIVVMASLIFSIIETKLILPAHLRHVRIGDPKPGERGIRAGVERLQFACSNGMRRFVDRVYQPFLEYSLRRRYITIGCFIAVFVVVVSFLPAGLVRVLFFPEILSDEINIDLKMPASAPWQRTHDYIRRIADAADSVNARYRDETGEDRDVIQLVEVRSNEDTSARIESVLLDSSRRKIGSVTIADWWRDALGPLPGIKSLTFDARAGPDMADIDLELSGTDLTSLRRATERVKAMLAGYQGVFDISDSFGAGAPEVNITLKPQGELLGLGQAELARQVRQAFFGAEIQRVQRDRHEVRVYARLPKAERDSLATLENLWIALPDGQRVPFDLVAHAEPIDGISTINRHDRARVVNVRASVDKTQIEPERVEQRLNNGDLAAILQDYPGISYRFAGFAESRDDDLGALYSGALLVLAMIYMMLAIPLKSYVQPLYIMSAIPFGIVGAVLGHWMLGKPVSFFSLIGMIALAGVVVNDSLVLVDYINQRIAAGADRMAAVLEAGARRFRAVILTSATTFLGLLPIQLETSIQSEFIKPMAISVGFGVLFATFVTLLLVPTLYYIAADVRDLFSRNAQPQAG